MKILLLICLATGWASTEKLDRSYLPPPGSKFSGGSPGDIQVPLEFPKLNYSTVGPQIGARVPDRELGINGRPLPADTVQGSTQKPDGFTYFQNSYTVPKTTTSYAFTQTTTFVPIDDYNELDQNSGFLNASNAVQQTGLSQYPKTPGQNYQQQQPIRGQSSSQSPNYNLFQQGQNFQSTLTPYGSTTQGPQFVNNQNRLAYLPPAPSSNYKGQVPSGQLPYDQDDAGYPSGLPQGPKYQDGQQFTSTTRPSLIEAVNQQNQFIGTPTTAAPQYQDERYDPSTGPAINQQRFGSRLPIQQNQQLIPGNFPSSTAAPQQITTPESVEHNLYTENQKFPSSTLTPQYQYGQRFTTPGSSQQRFGSQIPNQQTQSKYPDNQQIPSSISGPIYQDGQQFATPGLLQQNQYSGNQNFPSTLSPQYQGSQLYTTPGAIQEGFVPNRQIFGSQIPSQENQNQYVVNKNLLSSTVVPQQPNGQRFTTPEAVQPKLQNQYPGNQNFPSSTISPQYQNGQRYTTQESIQQGSGALAPGQQNQNQYPGNQYFQPSTAAPQITNGPFKSGSGYPGSPQQNQFQYQENQNFPSSTGIPEYQNGQFITAGLAQQNQYSGIKNTPSTTGPQINNDQRLTAPNAPLTFGPLLPNRQNYSGSQTPIQNENQQYPSTAAPQYQSTFASTSGSNQGFTPNQQNFNQYAERPGYNQQFSSTSAQAQNDNDGIQTLPGTSVLYPAIQAKPGTQFSLSYGNQQTRSRINGTTSSEPGYSNQGVPSVMDDSMPIRDFSLSSGTGAFEQNRPERPQAASDRHAEIISYDNMLTPEGYSYSYDTSNGIHADETGIVQDGTKAQGGFSYIGDDGKVYSVIYSADENGFQPRGDHLPTPPPIPDAIQRVIEQANKDKESGISDDGSYNEDKYGHMNYDGSLISLRPQNKTISIINGADIPNSYQSRIGEKNKNQLKTKGGSKPNYPDKDSDELEKTSNQTQIDDEHFDDSNDRKTNRRISNKYPRIDQKLKVDGVKLTGEINSNEKIDSLKNRKPIDRKGLDSRPVSEKINQDSAFDNVSATDNPDENDDFQESQAFDEESDLTSYRDDPNSRTDFHGINKYLPNSKESNKFVQSDKKLLLTRPDGNKQRVTASNKLERPGNRKNQGAEETIYEIKQAISNKDRVRIPARNKVAQKNNDLSKLRPQEPTDGHDESDTYGDNRAKTNEKYGSDVDIESGDVDFSTQSGVYPIEKKIIGHLKRPVVNEGTTMFKNKNIQTLLDEETGYEYTPPQRKFESKGTVELPSRTTVTEKPQFPSQKGAQTTIRPFITPNVYGNDKKSKEDDDDQFDSERKPYLPGRPTSPQKPKTPEVSRGNDQYNVNAYPEMAENEKFDAGRKPSGQYGTTTSRQPFGRPQTTEVLNYKDQDMTGQGRYNEPMNYQGPRRPSNNVIYGVSSPKQSAAKSESNAFVSTTPLPNLESEYLNKYQRPGQHLTTNIPNDDSPNFEGTTPGVTNSRGRVPSTTYRPSYAFGDRTLPPSGSIAVDGFGRPISSTNAPVYDKTYGPVTQITKFPLGFEEVSETRPGNMRDKFRPSVGKFGVTSAPTQGSTGVYEGSSPGSIIGEDFSGPKQPQRFDPDTGYHYK